MIVNVIKICSFRPQLDTGEPAAVGTETCADEFFMLFPGSAILISRRVQYSATSDNGLQLSQIDLSIASVFLLISTLIEYRNTMAEHNDGKR